MSERNLRLLTAAAEKLLPILDELVFVGGCVTGLLITDPAAAEVRPTFDVDAIAEITSYFDYQRFAERLRALEFTEDTREGAPLCRWRNGDVTLDVMPLDEKVLGFSNRWYEPAMVHADNLQLRSDLQVRIVTAPFFIGTKLEAFNRRGRGDFQSSHDLEDLVAVVDGRQQLLEEIKASPEDLRTYIAEQLAQLLKTPGFIDSLPGYLMPDAGSQERIGALIEKLDRISAMN